MANRQSTPAYWGFRTSETCLQRAGANSVSLWPEKLLEGWEGSRSQNWSETAWERTQHSEHPLMLQSCTDMCSQCVFTWIERNLSDVYPCKHNSRCSLMPSILWELFLGTRHCSSSRDPLPKLTEVPNLQNWHKSAERQKHKSKNRGNISIWLSTELLSKMEAWGCLGWKCSSQENRRGRKRGGRKVEAGGWELQIKQQRYWSLARETDAFFSIFIFESFLQWWHIVKNQSIKCHKIIIF